MATGLAGRLPNMDGSGPDLMNDPRYATNLPPTDDSMVDADTCRICRGEATEQEPLFYPCKCNGSIKFVHQDCLMEWLLHSQKKHCELCKTPFRFTKLYSPTMPQTLPFHVFVQHLIIHSVRNLTSWLRFCLVIFVWLGCLPWAMRHVWDWLFWFADGGWSLSQDIPSAAGNSTFLTTLGTVAQQQLDGLAVDGTCLASPVMALPTSSVKLGPMMQNLPAFIRSALQLNHWDAMALSSSSVFKLVNWSIIPGPKGAASQGQGEGAANTTQIFTERQNFTAHQASLLSNVRFLNNLTRYPRINNLLIATMEGQIITIIVVVCFILVFLIREWVVQQQPGVNMGAGFNAELAGGGRPRNAVQGELPVAENLAHDIPRREGLEIGGRMPVGVGARPIARPRRRIARVEEEHGPNVERALEEMMVDYEEDRNGMPDPRDTNSDQGALRNRRPVMPTRDALTSAAEIQRRLTEEPSESTSDGMVAGEFISIWRRANGSPEEVLRIIETEGLNEKLRYWKNAMITLNQGPVQRSVREPESESRDTEGAALRGSDLATYYTDRANLQESRDSAGTEDGTFLPVPAHDVDTASSDKGKEKAVEPPAEPLFDPNDTALAGTGVSHSRLTRLPEATSWSSDNPRLFQSSPTRQRAASDGPRIKDSISPLASNSWTFTKLPITDESPAPADNFHAISEGLSWKTMQDIRVRDAVNKGREAKNEISHMTMPSMAGTDESVHTPISLSEPVTVYDQGVESTTSSWGDVTADDRVSDSDAASDDGVLLFSEEEITAAFQDELFHSDDHLPVPVEDDQSPPAAAVAALAPNNPPEGFFGRVADWLWGDMAVRPETPPGDDEHIVQDIAAEPPFVPVAQNHDAFGDDDSDDSDNGDQGQDREVVAAALAAGIDPNDPDAMDDAEDFEGIMELMGMRGPLAGLIQNGLFSAVLISLTVALGVWVPYNLGRLVILLAANPISTMKLPLKVVFSSAAVLQDLTLVVLGSAAYLLLELCMLPKYLYSVTTGGPAASNILETPGLALECVRVAGHASERILDGMIGALIHLPESEVPAFSALSHEALLQIKDAIAFTVHLIGSVTAAIFTQSPINLLWKSFIGWSYVIKLITAYVSQSVGHITAASALMAKSDSWVITLNIPEREIPVDPSLACWSGTDRFWAILAGYVAFCFIGATYLRKGSPFSSSQTGREWEATIIDMLNQAGGVMKVILIISIEMLVFPLYCGLLLDMALLPLFDNATMLSRAVFTIDTPLTSIFVHWFVGTCYMFHFALFVSMCRKIMRSGVLYFIKDPDDPTFHPVRDVLERNVATQLRKITFSAMVYGALVVICLGGVVWSLAYAFNGVLPIHWSSNEPVLEFPIDLLFYNFFMPLAVKFFQPSDGLHAMYTWWFRKCARFLRLTWFLFDQQKPDEEGHHVRRSWRDVLLGVQGDIEHPISKNDLTNRTSPFDEDPDLRAYFVLDGRYVRTPASDQVRLPKGVNVFLDVNALNERLDGYPDHDDGLHGRSSEMFKMVYVPPHFRLRVFLFVLFLWLFAAVTGVGLTIIPLVFGRLVFSKIIPSQGQKNDVYAFSIGIYLLGSALYCLLHLKDGYNHLRSSFAVDSTTPRNVCNKVSSIMLWVLRLIYAYSAFALLLPSLFAMVVEFYFIIPLHTYFAVDEPHVIHFVQSWTLGLLYVKLTTRFILWHADSRPAGALRAVTRRGYLDPDIRIASRCFIFPATVLLGAALIVPFGAASLASRWQLLGPGPTQQMLLYRYAYPLCLFFVIDIYLIWSLLGMLKGWRMKIRDEVYLIGERLHNFGDRSKSGAGALMPNSNRIET